MGLVKPDARFIAVNKVLCDLLGYTKQELIGQSAVDITYEEDKEKSRKFSRQLFTGITPVVRFKKRYVRKNGDILWLNITSSAIHDKEGNIPYSQIIIESLTESIKAAEKIHLMAYYDNLTGLPVFCGKATLLPDPLRIKRKR
jgi:PAS domain S-box-containing protein